ncbi:SH2 domain-containing protein [Obelidium mucronatum]|nr:SH2 domain-containing protein [Obelidium mucronatum]
MCFHGSIDFGSDNEQGGRVDDSQVIEKTTTKRILDDSDSDDDIDKDIAAAIEDQKDDDDDGDEEEEEVQRSSKPKKKEKEKKKSKRIEADSDDSSVEDSDDEMTEADKGFIVDDDDVSDAGGDDDDDDEEEDLDAKRRRKEQRKLLKRKRREEEEDLDDEDLALIDENTGRGPSKKKGGRLVRKGGQKEDQAERRDLSNIFDMDDDEDARVAAPVKPKRKSELYSDEDSDEADDFVVDDNEDGDVNDETDFDRRARIAKAKEQRKADRSKVRNLGQQYGISDDVWMDIQDLFGDGMDYEYALFPSDGSKPRESYRQEEEDEAEPIKKTVKLTDIYEPSEIAERLLTEEDEVIRLKDVPERFQLRTEYPPLTDDEFNREVEHIETVLLASTPEGSPIDLATETSRQTVISRTLKFFHEEHFEVPFLFGHRKDYLTLEGPTGNHLGHLNRSELWKIYDLDTQFQAVEAKRRSVRTLITDLRTSPELAGNRSIEVLLGDRYVDEMLRTAASLEDIADVTLYLQLYYSEEIKKVEEAKGKRKELKRAIRRTDYEDAKRLGIQAFVSLYNVDVKLFSESMKKMVNLHVPDDLPEDPLDAATKFIVEKSPFSTEQRVIEAGRMMLAQQISVDPTYRRFLRKVYETDAVITVTPTERGKVEITPVHPYYKFKYLKEKPVYKFEGTEYLLIHKAEIEGLVTVRVFVDEEAKLLEDVVKHITNDYTSEISERWNDERRRCGEKATKELIFPAVVKSFKEMLASKATDLLAEECRTAFEKKIDVQPYRHNRSRDDDYYDDHENRTHARVMAISWGDGDPQSAVFAICLDESGRVSSTTKLSHMHNRDLKVKDHDLILSKMRELQIEVLVVGGTSISTKQRLIPELVESLKRINDDTESSERDRRRYRRGEFVVPELVVVEDDVARILMTSKRFAKEFPDFPPLARYCVSLGRRVQDTTLEFATLFNADEEIKLLRAHPLQHLLPDDKLKSAIERAFVNVVNMNGVDVNDAASFPHRSHTLQFVSGLGPRKAGFIINRIGKSGGKLESRPDLIQKRMLGRAIFMNAASFIKIHKKHFKRTNAPLDVLDNTRIHPEDYDIARKMAAGALDIDDVVEADDPSSHVAELMDDHPERLNNLMLDDFADELYRTSQDLKRITLRDIKDEIIDPYKDRRVKFNSAGWNEIFTMLTGEVEEGLLGMVVSCQVVKNFDRFMKCKLSASGVDANLQAIMCPSQRTLKEGDAFQAVVIKVDIREFRVELDAREDIVDSGKWLMDLANRVRDPKYFSLDREEEDKQRKPPAPKPKPKPKRSRTVNHPYWKNCTYQEAIDELTGPSVRNGSLIIRPSTKGNDHICISWKVDEGVFQHIDILETNKDNEFTLGKTLIIDGKKYDDLEEIVATYVEPMAQYFSEARRHVKYRNDTVDETLRWVERAVQSTKRSSYAVIPCPEKPQCLWFIFQHIGKKECQEYITITPNGFKFRGAFYKRMDHLFDAFKKQEQQRMEAAKSAAKQQQQSQHQQGGYPRSSGPSYPSSRGPPGMSMPPRPQAPSSMMSGGGGRMPPMPSRPGAVSAAVPMYGQPPAQAGWAGPPGMRPQMPPQYPPQQAYGQPQQQYPSQQQQPFPPHLAQQQQQYRPQGASNGGYYGR